MRVLRISLLLATLLGSACTMTQKLPPLEPFTTRSITLVAEPEANGGQALEVEIIFAKDVETLKHIEGYTAQGWASVQQTQVGDWEGKIVSMTYSLSPGQTVRIKDFPEGYAQAVGYVVFAHYQNPGLHRQVFIEEPEAVVYMHKGRISSSAGKAFELTSPPELPNTRSSRF